MREIIRQRRLNFLHYILAQDKETILYKVFEAQNKNKNKKDWITSVINDLVEIELNVTFASIQKMGKQQWRNMIRNRVELKTFRKLEATKLTHSKVKNVKHIRLEMQDYFMPNKIENMNKEEVQMIFKIRCRNLNIKMNMKNQYETLECLVCFKEDETQEHVYVCEQISEQKMISNSENPKYEQIFSGTVYEKVKIARIIRENLKI